MAERRPLVLVSGQIRELPSGDTLPGGGSGDVVGPASSVDTAIAVFTGTTGKEIAEVAGATLANAGVGLSDVHFKLLSAPASGFVGAVDIVARPDVAQSTFQVTNSGTSETYEALVEVNQPLGSVDSKVRVTVPGTAAASITQKVAPASAELTLQSTDLTTTTTTFNAYVENGYAMMYADLDGEAVNFGAELFDRFSIFFTSGFTPVGERLDFTAAGELLLSGDPGTAGQVLTSGGTGAPATWQDGGGGNQITVSATAPASPTLNQLWLDIS